jgi:hypothetical protein
MNTNIIGEQSTLSYPPQRVILLPSSIRRQAARDYQYEEDEWSTGVPAAIMVSKVFLKELFCHRWNNPRIQGVCVCPGHILIPKHTEVDVFQLDGRPVCSARFEQNERLYINEVGYDNQMEQFVFRANNRGWLPIDWETFTSN